MLRLKKRSLPLNMRQSGDVDAKIKITTRLRKGPYWHLAVKAGAWAFATYNHTYHPRAYVKPEDGGLMKEYEYITKHVTMWDVAVERQIQVKGPDAAAFVDRVITRDVYKKLPVNKARYVILCNQKGGIINDPVLLRTAEDEFRFSISDSDVLLWCQGVNYKGEFNVDISEVDISPVQIQGPKSVQLMRKLFGDGIMDMKYYTIWQTDLNGLRVDISRTGFSAEVGFEIYLHDAVDNSDEMWNTVLAAGEEFNLHVIAPSHVRRLEAAILSYGQDMDIETNPFEVNLDWQVDFNKEGYIGKEALVKIKEEGIEQRMVGLAMGGTPITWYNPDYFIVKDESGENEVGYVTSAFFSPRLDCNIALAMMPIGMTAEGTKLKAVLPEDGPVDVAVVPIPFVDPKKSIPAQNIGG